MPTYLSRAAMLAMSASSMAFLSGFAANAQEQRWVQIEAHRDLDTALERAAEFERRIGNISGFLLESDWYALSIGPFETEIDAFAVRRQLRSEQSIPADAFVSNGSNYLDQIFPTDGSQPAPVAVETPMEEAVEDIVEEVVEMAEAAPEREPEAAPEETLREAQASERQLTRDERMELQTAMQWFGVYTLGIDGDFGPGTRRAMAAWQAERGHEETGVLTTRQRAELLDSYAAELAALGMQTWESAQVGISIDLPLAMVEFDRLEAPFAHFRAKDDSGVQVLLISQTGTEATLFGLYEIMQTLEIVPLDGARERQRNSFLLTGQSDSLRSHTFARHSNGQVKGYTLIWTPERDEQMARVLPMMDSSFAIFGDALPDSIGAASSVPRGALLAGLDVRRPEFSRSGFYVDAKGTVMTAANGLDHCARITIDEAFNAQIIAQDDALDVAVLQPETPLVPLAYAQFHDGQPTGTAATVSGFSFGDMLTRPVLTFGNLELVGGLDGDEGRFMLNANIQQGDHGGPVFGANGSVIGLLTGQPQDTGRQFPPELNSAVASDALRALLRETGVSSGTSGGDMAMTPEALTRVSADMTVLVSCWK